jgi:hypothetical protein
MAKHPMDDALTNAEAYLKQALRQRRLANAAPDLLAACKLQHDAIDMLFVMLIDRSPPGETFHPSKSGAPWEALVAGNAAIAKAEPPETNQGKDAT